MRLRIDTPAQTVVGGECSTVVKVQRQTATGIDYTGPAIAVQMSGDGFSFFDDPACANPASVLWISTGTHTNDLYFRNDRTGARTLSLSATGYSGTSQEETILAPPAPSCFAAQRLFSDGFDEQSLQAWTGQTYSVYDPFNGQCHTSDIVADATRGGVMRSVVSCSLPDSHRAYGGVQFNGDDVLGEYTNAGQGIDAPYGLINTFFGHG